MAEVNRQISELERVINAQEILTVPCYLKPTDRDLIYRRVEGALRYFRAHQEGDLSLL